MFDAWCSATDRDPNRTRLTDKRRRRVQARLREGYTPQELLDAVSGIAASGWHRGDNDRGHRYDDLEFVCRNGENVERFRDLARDPPKRSRPRPKGMAAAEWLKAQQPTEGELRAAQ